MTSGSLGRRGASLAVLAAVVAFGSYLALGHGRRGPGRSPSAGAATLRRAAARSGKPRSSSKPGLLADATRERAGHEMTFVRRALARAVARAHLLGGTVQVAVWADGWPAPVALGDDLTRPMRMWSMAKPIEAIAAIAGAARDRVHLSAGFGVAMQRALQRSENCSARRMVLELQQLDGGTAGARAAFRRTLREAGARPVVATQEDGPADQSADCEAFLARHRSGLAEADGTAVLFGTSLWTVSDAVRFAHTLGDGRYGSAGEVVLRTMAEPKELSQEPGATFTADPRWGAGLAFRSYPVAYKAGWGGTRQRAFLAGQLAVVTDGRRHVAVAAMFHPGTQPAIDDPGETEAPRALEAVFAAVAKTLPRLARSRSTR